MCGWCRTQPSNNFASTSCRKHSSSPERVEVSPSHSISPFYVLIFSLSFCAAGKTETTKKCLQLLSSLSAATHPQSQTSSSSREPSSSSGSSHTNIEDRILATNPVLESFGNSKTARNNNSSRFGKWIQVNYTLASSEQEQVYPKLFGAQITQYLLEKSRVVIHAADERNYHIFYQLCASGELDMQPAASYRYLRYSKNMKIPGVDDKAEFQLTKESMKALGFSGK